MSEQRYKAVLAVIGDGRTVTEVANDWVRCAESPSHRASDRQKGLVMLISQDEPWSALRATLRQADLETSSAQAARWYSLISPLRRC